MRAIALGLLISLSGCAALMNLDQHRPEVVMDRALEAYERLDFRAAYEQLSWVYSNFWNRRIGERALLTMAAVELDPRNPGRRFHEGAELASWYGDLPAALSWNVPVSRTLEGMARELDFAYTEIERLDAEKDRAERERDAARSEAARATRDAEAARTAAAAAREEARRAQAQARAAARRPAPAPAAPQPSAPVGVSALQAERDGLASEVQQLRRSLAQRERELERIRQTITPR
jgi:chemotaxis protein histidine kinase CheA